MELSVVVATLNARDRLGTCLDALASRADDAEVVVVNGPSTDGTTGMVRERDDVDVLVEIADRNVNVARNAGFEAATGDSVAFLSDEIIVQSGWRDAIVAPLADGAGLVSGPVNAAEDSAPPSLDPIRSEVDSLGVERFAGENLVVTREALAAIDGFDEYLTVDGAYDAAYRATTLDFPVAWAPGAAVEREPGAVRTDGFGDPDWGATYRSLSYRLAKTFGPRPVVLGGTLRRAIDDGVDAFGDVLEGTFPPSRWLGNGWTVGSNCCRGFAEGLLARYRSQGELNPNGASARPDRAVRTYDWR